MKWSYGVTTTPQRTNDLLPQTLQSLKLAGFDRPHLFVDGSDDSSKFAKYKLDTTLHFPNVRTYGHWVLSLWELYVLDPTADRYAIFQDDFVTYRNLRKYLEHCGYPSNGYWNLYTFPSNQLLASNRDGTEVKGWYESNQMGRGAVALIFSRTAVVALLASPHMVTKPQDCTRGWRSVDGAVVTAFKQIGWKEYVHNPSLTQHLGQVSSMGNIQHPQATSFLGESFDAMELLK